MEWRTHEVEGTNKGKGNYIPVGTEGLKSIYTKPTTSFYMSVILASSSLLIKRSNSRLSLIASSLLGRFSRALWASMSMTML